MDDRWFYGGEKEKVVGRGVTRHRGHKVKAELTAAHEHTELVIRSFVLALWK